MRGQDVSASMSRLRPDGLSRHKTLPSAGAGQQCILPCPLDARMLKLELGRGVGRGNIFFSVLKSCFFLLFFSPPVVGGGGFVLKSLWRARSMQRSVWTPALRFSTITFRNRRETPLIVVDSEYPIDRQLKIEDMHVLKYKKSIDRKS